MLPIPNLFWQEWQSRLAVVDTEPKRLIRWLLEGYGITVGLELPPLDSFSADVQEKIKAGLVRLENKEPISKVLETAYFYGREFKTTLDTLDPRLDTQCLIDEVLKRFDKHQAFRFIDLGTGTGCIAITLLKEREKATAVVVDISPQALEVAKENAKAHGVDDRITFHLSHWLQGVPFELFDVVVSNPPYVEDDFPLEDNVRLYDPALALFAGIDGMRDYNHLIPTVHNILKPNGFAFFEISTMVKDVVRQVASNAGYTSIETVKDTNMQERVLILR